MSILGRTFLTAATAMLFASSASASLIGTTVDLTATATPGTTILSGTPASATVSAASEFFVCVGPAGNSCSTSGLSVNIDIQSSAIVFSFAGSTTGQATGPFSIDLTGFDETITAVTLGASNPFVNDSFGVGSFTGNSIHFVANPAPTPGFNAVGGRSYTFNLTTESGTTAAAVPEPASIALVGLALAGLGLSRRRKA